MSTLDTSPASPNAGSRSSLTPTSDAAGTFANDQFLIERHAFVPDNLLRLALQIRKSDCSTPGGKYSHALIKAPEKNILEGYNQEAFAALYLEIVDRTLAPLLAHAKALLKMNKDEALRLGMGIIAIGNKQSLSPTHIFEGTHKDAVLIEAVLAAPSRMTGGKARITGGNIESPIELPLQAGDALFVDGSCFHGVTEAHMPFSLAGVSLRGHSTQSPHQSRISLVILAKRFIPSPAPVIMR